MNFRALAGLAAACALAFPASAADTRPPPPSRFMGEGVLVASDPAVRRGMLDNGLRYAVMRAALPKGAMSIRLGVRVGSYEEAEQERGVAHFLEHLAFRTTRSFPDNSIDGAFAARGVEFGRDHNAFTNLFATWFEMDMPRADGPDTEKAFRWLRDVADGIVFDPAAIDKERGVVLAEKEARNDAEQASMEAIEQFSGPELRSFDRATIGLESVLRNVSPAELQAFYRRWYRPDNAVVVVVGDLPPEVMEAQIRSTFASWKAEGPPPARAAFGRLEAGRGLDAFTRSEPSLSTRVYACRLHAAAANPPQDLARVRETALGDIWREALNQRLASVAGKPANLVLSAKVHASDEDGDHVSVCLGVNPSGDAWSPALAAAAGEFLRFQRSGPTELEVEAATDTVRASLRGDITTRPSRTAPDLATDLVLRMLKGEVLVEPRQALRNFDLAVEDITVEDVRAAFARDWSGVGPLVTLVSPHAPTAREVREAWVANEKATSLDAYADRKAPDWGYHFGPPGVVDSRQAVAQGQFVRIRFKNGVVLNFKHTDFAKDNVVLVARFGAGRKEIANEDYAAAAIGANLFAIGGTGRHSYEDIGLITRDQAREFAIEVADDNFSIPIEASTATLESRLRVITAYLLDPAFSPILNPFLHETAEATYRNLAASPAQSASNAMAATIAPDSLYALPPKARLQAIDSAKVAAVLKSAVTAAPIEVTLVGDIDEKTAIQRVAETFGALPPRTPQKRERSDIAYLRFPNTPQAPIRTTHVGPADKAVGQLIWPLYVGSPERRREEYAIRLMAAVFNNELRRRVRGELGKTYAPDVSVAMSDGGDQGTLTAAMESLPADLDTVLSEARALARRLAAGEISADQLEEARGPMLASAAQGARTNAWWAWGLAGSSTSDQNLRNLMSYADTLRAVSLQDVRTAAAEWLAAEPVVVAAVPAPALAAPAAVAEARP